jgi:hypothetical protein
MWVKMWFRSTIRSRFTGRSPRSSAQATASSGSRKPAVSGTLKFPDARALGYGPETDTYKSIVWGTQLEITKGYSDGSFKPLANCLREHIVTFVYRYDQKYNQ